MSLYKLSNGKHKEEVDVYERKKQNNMSTLDIGVVNKKKTGEKRQIQCRFFSFFFFIMSLLLLTRFFFCTEQSKTRRYESSFLYRHCSVQKRQIYIYITHQASRCEAYCRLCALVFWARRKEEESLLRLRMTSRDETVRTANCSTCRVSSSFGWRRVKK